MKKDTAKEFKFLATQWVPFDASFYVEARSEERAREIAQRMIDCGDVSWEPDYDSAEVRDELVVEEVEELDLDDDAEFDDGPTPEEAMRELEAAGQLRLF